jgi:hypothetical protein
MDNQVAQATATQDQRSRAGTYLAVILVEALVIAGLYLFGRFFSA